MQCGAVPVAHADIHRDTMPHIFGTMQECCWLRSSVAWTRGHIPQDLLRSGSIRRKVSSCTK
jgi:hypothetical protein